jgi:hypothetical protein
MELLQSFGRIKIIDEETKNIIIEEVNDADSETRTKCYNIDMKN